MWINCNVLNNPEAAENNLSLTTACSLVYLYLLTSITALHCNEIQSRLSGTCTRTMDNFYFFLARKKNDGVKISSSPPLTRSMAVALRRELTRMDPLGAILQNSRKLTII